MRKKVAFPKQSILRRQGGSLAPGLLFIVATAEAAGWLIRQEDSFVELLKPPGSTAVYLGYQINSRWWCRGLSCSATEQQSKAFRVTAPILRGLLGIPDSS